MSSSSPLPPLPPLPALAATGLAHLERLLLEAAGGDPVISRADADRQVSRLLAEWRGAEARLVREGFDRLDALDAGSGARVTRADLGELERDLRAQVAAVDPFSTGLDRPGVRARLSPVAAAAVEVGMMIRAGVLDSPAFDVRVADVENAGPDIAALFHAVGATLALDEHWARRASYTANLGGVPAGVRDGWLGATLIYRGITGSMPPVPLSEGWPSRVFAWLERTFAVTSDPGRHAERRGAYDALVERLVADNRGREIAVWVAAGPWAWPDEGAQVLWLLSEVGTAYLWTLAV